MNVDVQTPATQHCFRGTKLSGLRALRRRAPPVASESLAQLASGKVRAKATLVHGSAGTVYHAGVYASSASSLANLHSAYTGIVIPLRWHGRFVINGSEADNAAIYAPVDETLFQVHGSSREVLAFAVPRHEFVAHLAALQGVGAEELQLAAGAINLPRSIAARLRQRLTSLLRAYLAADRSGALSLGAHDDLARAFLTAIAGAYLHARPLAAPERCGIERCAAIVRKAEECFESAQAGIVTLADLCAAAEVSQGTLHTAFMRMCGDSPMAHFRKRRLTEARCALLEPESRSQLVKGVALDTGFTHFGRFSADYRRLFGESPSATLSRSAR